MGARHTAFKWAEPATGPGVLPPVVALVVQWLASSITQPHVWDLFYPAVFSSDLRRARDDLRRSNEEVTRLYEKTRELDELKSRFFGVAMAAALAAGARRA